MGKNAGVLGIVLCLMGMVIVSCGSPTLEISCSIYDLISAIDYANSDPDLSTIILDQDCLYNLFEADYSIDYQEGTSGESGFTGLPPITTPIIIEGNDATIQRLNSASEMRFFFVTTTGELTLEELTLNNGLVQTGQIHQRNGGAIFNRGVLNLVESHVLSSYAEDNGGALINWEGATANINNSSISYNQTGGHGGAISNAGTLFIDGYSIINHNQADGSGGAINTTGDLTITGGHVSFNQAVFTGGAISTNLQPVITLDGVLFEGNTAEGAGGAINFIFSTFMVTDCIFNQNAASGPGASGGAVYIMDSSGDVATDTTFFENSANRHGGGVYIHGTSTVSLNTVVFQDNTAALDGGGLANAVQQMTVDVLDSSFVGNNALRGGGLANSGEISIQQSLLSANTSTEAGAGIYNSGSMLRLTNSTVSGNYNQNVGGGLLNYGTMEILFSTIAFNQSMQGGGLYDNGGGVQIKNTIIANNNPQSCSVFGAMTSLGDNLDDDGSCQGFNLTANPFLEGLADNGGPTLTHGFLFTNYAFEGVTDCTDIPGTTAINHDQRGFQRPFGFQCDLGAFEETAPLSDFLSTIMVELELIDCLEGPDEAYNPRASYYSGDALTALGRTEDGAWLGVIPPEEVPGEVFCWVPSDGVESTLPIASFPVLFSPDVPPDEPRSELSRCELFTPKTYSLTLLDIPYGTGDLTLYLTMPEGVPGLEVEIPDDIHPWVYTAILGQYQDEMCTFDGYAGRLYCRLELPESYLGTVRELNIYVNRCEEPIYTHAMVTIPEPPLPLACSPDLAEPDCLAAGGTYSCGSSSDCECTCP